MNVLILSMGTRGDIEPYIGLAQTFKSIGINPSLASTVNYKNYVESFDINFISINDAETSPNEAVSRLLENTGFKAIIQGIALMFEGMEKAHIKINQLVSNYDIIIGHGWLGELEAEMNQKLFIRVSISPNLAVQKTKTFSSKVAKILGNYFLKKLILKPYNSFRNKYGVADIDINQIQAKPLFLPLPDLLTKNLYFKDSVFQSNYWFPDQKVIDFPEELKEFFAKKKKRLLLNFGSMTWASKNLNYIVSEFIEAASEFDLDVLWIGTHIDINVLPKKNNVQFFQLKEFPHQYIFPKIDIIAHHCGLGTTCSVLRSAIPSIPVPYVVDQIDWAKKLYTLNIASKPIGINDLNKKELLKRIDFIINNNYFHNRLKSIKDDMNKQRSGADAVKKIIEIYNTAQVKNR